LQDGERGRAAAEHTDDLDEELRGAELDDAEPGRLARAGLTCDDERDGRERERRDGGITGGGLVINTGRARVSARQVGRTTVTADGRNNTITTTTGRR